MEMEKAIVSLGENFDKLELELEQEEREFKQRFGSWFSEDFGVQESINLEQQIQTHFSSQIVKSNELKELQKLIVSKQITLGELVNSVKEKLQSKSKFSETKQKDRSEKLDSFFKNFPTSQDEFVKGLDNIKENLSKKLT
jgi:uncharacterized protein (DUF2344 family)